MNKLKYFGAVLIAVAGLCPSARAVNTYLGEGTAGYAAHYTSATDAHLIGTVIPGQQIPGQGQAERDVTMTNFLLGMAAGQQTTNGSLWSRTSLAGSGAATNVGSQTNFQLGQTFPNGFSGPVTIDLDAVGTFKYLVVAYDGPNSGVVVWNITGLTGTIQFDSYASPDGTTGNLFGSNGGPGAQYKITGYTLLNPSVVPIPDGGATVMLLGGALGALGVARRFLKR